MPSRAARSGIRGRPPLSFAGSSGSKGSIASHRSVGTSIDAFMTHDHATARRVLKQGLILQRHFQRRLREAAFVVAAAGLSLALAPPAGPMQAKAVVRAITEQQGEQAPHLRCGQGNQATVRFPLLAAAARVTSRKA
jgi:hypothetical protein